jgi:hypothetical protein
VAVLAVVPIAAQSKDSERRQTTTFRADARLVVLHAAVVDKSGRLLMNLQQKAFRVFENGVAQPIKKFLPGRSPCFDGPDIRQQRQYGHQTSGSGSLR